jgi:hypothetical protein
MSMKVNVGVSRKVSRDYQSHGYSLNIEGEVLASTSDPEKLVEEVKEFFDLAEEALDQQIERAQSTAAIASRDEEPRVPARQYGNGHRAAPENGRRSPPSNGNGQKDETATNKQIQYLLSIGKRMKLSTAALEGEIEQVLGEQVGLYDLTKKQAGVVIDGLTATAGSRA